MAYSSEDDSNDESDEPLSWDERIITLVFAVLMPALICFVSWGSIMLAYYEWKMY